MIFSRKTLDILIAVCYNKHIKRKGGIPMGKKKKGHRNQTAKLLEAIAKVLIGLAALITAIAKMLER